MMTPEEYFEQHPDVAVLAWREDLQFTEWLNYDSRGQFSFAEASIDWSGYTRKIAFNPNFAWGKRREVEWRSWNICENNGVPFDTIDQPYDRVDLPDGAYAYRFGRYVDETDVRDERRKHLDAIDEKPELSRFLPEGWGWKQAKNGGNWLCGPYAYCFFTDPVYWHKHGLLHPSEGGGFERMKSLTELNKRDVDILYRNGFIDYENSGYSSGDCVPQGWRPHYKKGGES